MVDKDYPELGRWPASSISGFSGTVFNLEKQLKRTRPKSGPTGQRGLGNDKTAAVQIPT